MRELHKINIKRELDRILEDDSDNNGSGSDKNEIIRHNNPYSSHLPNDQEYSDEDDDGEPQVEYIEETVPL